MGAAAAERAVGADMVVELQRHQAVEVGFERAPFCVISLRHGGPTGETSRMVEPATDILNRKCGATTNSILIEIETDRRGSDRLHFADRCAMQGFNQGR